MHPTFTIGLAIPLKGPGGIYAPSCEAVSELAISELNRASGILGAAVRLEAIDAAAPSAQLRRRVQSLVTRQRIQALTGWHISSVRALLAPVVRGKLPYLYTSVHEGGRPELGATMLGEAAEQQVIPGLRWLMSAYSLNRWAIIGSDYIWPRRTATRIHALGRTSTLSVVHEEFLPEGQHSYAAALTRIEAASPDGVVMLLVGQDAVRFNREFAARGLDRDIARFSPLMEETMLLASGAPATANIYAAAAYFASLPRPEALDFLGRYVAIQGQSGPSLNNAAESCYEGILATAALASAAGSRDPPTLSRFARTNSFGYEGPRGRVVVNGKYSNQDIHVARADGYSFDVLDRLAGKSSI